MTLMPAAEDFVLGGPAAGLAEAAARVLRASPADGLRNGGFEGNYVPVAKPSSPKARIDGVIAPGWNDDSGWGEVSISYAQESRDMQSGAAAQRIEVHAIGQGAAQFRQNIFLSGGRIYRASAWLRAATNTPVEFQIRQIGVPYATYAKVAPMLSPEWRRCEFLVRMPSSIGALLMFNFGNPGTYWLDEVTCTDVTDSMGGDQPARPGNLFTNGSFEAGLAGGWNISILSFDHNQFWPPQEHLDLQASRDRQGAADGRTAMTFTTPPWTAGVCVSPLVHATLGRTYTASVALRSDRPRRVGLSLVGTSASTEVEIGTAWARYAISGLALLATDLRLRVLCANRDDQATATFWVDAAMLEEATQASPAYVAAFPTELRLAVPRPGGIVFDGETAPLTVEVIASDAAILAGARLLVRVEDLAGRVIDLPPVALPTDGFAIPFDRVSARGLFKIHAVIQDTAGRPLSAAGERIFARLPQPCTLTPEQEEASYFGAHVELNPDHLAIAKATGARWVRLHDVSFTTLWSAVQPRPGPWMWHDDGVAAARAAGLHVLGVLGGAPPWASRRPQANNGYFAMWNLPDSDGAEAAWSAYVQATVSHFAPLIGAWEVWNEPYINGASNAFFPNGTAEQYGNLLRRAATATRAANPKATLVGVCAPGNDPAWLDRVLTVAGPDQFDALSFHYYGGRLQTGQPNHVMQVTAELNRRQAQRGSVKPLWNSEGGLPENASWYRRDAATQHHQMAAMVRLDVAHLAAGVRRFFPYTMSGGIHGQEGLALLDGERTIKSTLVARAVLASLIDGAAYVGRSEPAPGLEAHAFRHPDGSEVQVVWSSDGHAHPLTISAHALNVLGNPLAGATVQVGDEPIYVLDR